MLKDKPLMNHYGWRVSSREEVDRAQQYLKKLKDQYRLPVSANRASCTSPILFTSANREATLWRSSTMSPSMHKASAVYGPHWQKPYAAENSRAKATFARVFRTGHLECDDGKKDISTEGFIGEVLGLELVPLPPELPVLYLKDAFNPLVCRSRAAENSSLSEREQPVYTGDRFFGGGARSPSRVRKNRQRRSSRLPRRAKRRRTIESYFFYSDPEQKLVGDNCGE